MNVFYGVIILNLEELAEKEWEKGTMRKRGNDEEKGKEEKEISQEVEWAMGRVNSKKSEEDWNGAEGPSRQRSEG